MNLAFWRRKADQSLTPVGSGSGWFPVIREPYAGAWQTGDVTRIENACGYFAVYACITLIAADIGKLRVKLVELDGTTQLWHETASNAFSPVLRKPNHFQTHIQFKEQWLLSKLSRGNAYVLKQRDARGVVVALYVLDPCRVTPLVAPNGDVFYRLQADPLSQLTDTDGVVVPASEIIHDRMNCLYHPLVGLSPLYASGLSAKLGIAIQQQSGGFFKNGSRPGGVLTAPGKISDETAARLKKYWEENFAGSNAGHTAVLGDGLKYEPMAVTAADAQLIEQLKWTAEVVCSTFHVPAFKIGVGPVPTYQNAQVLNQIYYSDCLQAHIESLETCLDEGLGLDAPLQGRTLGTELDIDALLRMDTATQAAVEGGLVKNSVKSPNEARRRFDLPPVPGGDSPMMQQQNWSLAQLADRKGIADAPSVAPPPAATDEPPPDAAANDDAAKLFASLRRYGYEELAHG